MFDEVKVSDSQGKNVSQRRIHYLTFGTPEVGENDGNMEIQSGTRIKF